jgi:ATP-binding cassette subfamily B protein
LLLSSAASLLKPWPLALIVDHVLSGKPLPGWMSWAAGWEKKELLAVLGVSIAILYALHGALSAWQTYSSIRIGLRGLVRVRNEVFRWLEHLSLRLFQVRSAGDLIYRLSWDTYAFQTLIQQGIFTFLSASLSLLLMLLVMWRLNPPLAGLALLLIPLLILSMRFLGRGMNRRSLAAHQADSQVTSFIQEAMAALPLIQSYTREEFEQERFARRVDEAFHKRVAQQGWEVLYWLVMAVGFGIAAAGLTWLGADQVLSGRLTVGELLVFLGYLTQLYEPLNQLSHVGATLSDATAGTQRVLELLDTPQELQELSDARPLLTATRSDDTKPIPAHGSVPPLLVRGNLSLDHVSFGYTASRTVLADVTISVAPGESLAVIGPSGAGKTTLLQLLLRFYDPTAGAVRLEGVDLRQLRLKDLRAHVALVPQEPILLLASVAENIAYGRPGASAAEIEAAARAANADEFIRKLPQQYETRVGAGAVHLSAGEKQRINLARAFLKDAPILVLDEPTSALDAESEELVVQSLSELMEKRTAFLVAHRLSTVRRVDRIVVLEAGRIVEKGAPDELLRQGGYYARLAGGELRWE